MPRGPAADAALAPPQGPTIRLAQVLMRRGSGFRLAIDQIAFTARQQWAITGRPGSGKTVLASLIGLLAPPDKGHLTLELAGSTINVATLWQKRRSDELAALRRHHFGFVPGHACLFPSLDVRANVALAARIAGRRDALIEPLLTNLGLGGIARARPSSLSPFERQKVAVARAVVNRPSFLVADEPCAGLDPGEAEDLLAFMIETARNAWVGLLVLSCDGKAVQRSGLASVVIKGTRFEKGWLSAVRDSRP